MPPRRSRAWPRVVAVQLGLDRNALRRPTDRMEAIALRVAVVLAGAVIVFGAVAGHVVRESLQETAEHQAETRVRTVATVLDISIPRTPTLGMPPVQALVTWTTGGVDHVQLVPAPAAARRGGEVAIWTTADGQLTPPPMSRSKITATAVTSVVTGQLVALGLIAAAVLCARWAIDRRRYRAWDEEWFYLNRLGEIG